MTYTKYTKPKPTFIQFYFSKDAGDDVTTWSVWSRQFTDATLETLAEDTTWRWIERYDSEEKAKAAANEFQAVSNK